MSRNFFINFGLKIALKKNLRKITENHAADLEIGFLTKPISKPCGRATAMPTTWELIKPFPFLSFWLGVHGPAHK